MTTTKIEVMNQIINAISAPYVSHIDLKIKEKIVNQAVQWIAYSIRVQRGMPSPSFTYAVWEDLKRISIDPLYEDRDDFITEYLSQRFPEVIDPVKVRSTQACLEEAEARAGIYEPSTAFPKPKRVLDVAGNTSGVMIAYLDIMQDESITYYFVLDDLLTYQIALINNTLFDLHARILYADKSIHDLSERSTNWKFAGVWNPNPKNLTMRPAAE